jgi:hypothetical protein
MKVQECGSCGCDLINGNRYHECEMCGDMRCGWCGGANTICVSCGWDKTQPIEYEDDLEN